MLTSAPGFARLRSDEEAKFLCSPQTLNDFLVVGFFLTKGIYYLGHTLLLHPASRVFSVSVVESLRKCFHIR